METSAAGLPGAGATIRHELKGIRRNLQLAWDLAERDLFAKYRRSSMGTVWLAITPLGLLAIYTLVFGRIFGIQWSVPAPTGIHVIGFVLPFFVGLAVYLTVSDVVNSSATLFVAKRTFVVKSPFPLWVLWAANLMRASVHAAVLAILVTALSIGQGHLTVLGFVLAALNVALCAVFLAGLSLLLTALGPFIGDISEAMRLLLRVLFYATPITYPLSMVPEPVRSWMWLNPLTSMVELLRDPIVFGRSGPFTASLGMLAASIVLFAVASWIFSRVKGVISDVV